MPENTDIKYEGDMPFAYWSKPNFTEFFYESYYKSNFISVESIWCRNYDDFTAILNAWNKERNWKFVDPKKSE